MIFNQSTLNMVAWGAAAAETSVTHPVYVSPGISLLEYG
jgi:hypothetical protein